MDYSNLLEMSEHTVLRYSGETAIRNPVPSGGYQEWTYRELWNDVRKVAGQLELLGVLPGDKIGLVSESRAWWLITDLAVMSLGAVTVPTFPNLGPKQIFEILNHAEVKGVFAQDETQVEKLSSLKGQWARPLEFVVIYDTYEKSTEADGCKAAWKCRKFFDWLEAPSLLSETDWKKRWSQLKPTDLATIVYTSGTTGRPKGVILTHGNLLANLEGIESMVSVDASDTGISYLPLSHIFERTASQFVMLHAGATIVYSEGIDKIVSEFEKISPTVFTTVPRLLEKVHESVFHKVRNSSPLKYWLFHRALKAAIRHYVDKQPAPLVGLYDALVLKKIRNLFGGRLRLIVVGGAPLAPHIFEFFTALGICVVEGYGLTETSPVVAVNPVTNPRKGTVGRVLHNVDVGIAEDGEVLVRGDSVSQGYYRNPEATQAAFTSDGWFHTGDIGELSTDGYLKITDRKKNLLVLSTGKNVAPAPIEAAILASSLIEQVLVIGNGHKFVAAIVVPDALAVRSLHQRLHGEKQVPVEMTEQDLHDLLLKAVKKHTASFAEYEQPKKIIVAYEPFTMENELLTPTLKIRMNRVLDVYSDEINRLYHISQKPLEKENTGTE